MCYIQRYRSSCDLFTLLEHWRTVLISSWTTRSMHLMHGSFIFTICFFTIASKAMSGVNKPVLRQKQTELRSSSHGTAINTINIWSYIRSEEQKRICEGRNWSCKLDLHILNQQMNEWNKLSPDTMNVLDGVADFTTHFLLVTLHLCHETQEHFGWRRKNTQTQNVQTACPDTCLDQLKREALVEDAVDLGSARQLDGVHLIARTFDALLEVHRELLNHPVRWAHTDRHLHLLRDVFTLNVLTYTYTRRIPSAIEDSDGHPFQPKCYSELQLNSREKAICHVIQVQ